MMRRRPLRWSLSGECHQPCPWSLVSSSAPLLPWSSLSLLSSRLGQVLTFQKWNRYIFLTSNRFTFYPIDPIIILLPKISKRLIYPSIQRASKQQKSIKKEIKKRLKDRKDKPNPNGICHSRFWTGTPGPEYYSPSINLRLVLGGYSQIVWLIFDLIKSCHVWRWLA